MEQELELHVKTFGETFPDGDMIELVAGESPQADFNLLLWNGEEARIGSSFRLFTGPGPEPKPVIFEPPVVDSTFRRAIRFPTHAAPYESTWKLFDEIYTLVQVYTDLPEQLARLTTYSVFASWFPDRTDIPTCVSIVGPKSRQGAQVFRLLSCLFRRALPLGDVSLAGLCSFPAGLCPALFLKQRELTPQARKALCASTAQDTFILWKGRPVSLRCAKVVWSEDPLSDETLGPGAIEIPINPRFHSDVCFDQYTQQRIADDVQPKLLMYRLKNYHEIPRAIVDFPKLVPPLRDLGCCLAGCITDAPELREEVGQLLEERNQQIELERETDLNAVVVEAMFSLCHEENKDALHVGKITEVANEILKRLGEPLEMKPRSVGDKLRLLCLTTRRLDAEGRGILLLNATRQRIHQLAWDYKVPGVGGDEGQCQYCREAGRVQPMMPAAYPS